MGIKPEDLERIAKLAIAMGQQEGQPKGTAVFNKDFLKYYDHIELEVEETETSYTIRTKMKK